MIIRQASRKKTTKDSQKEEIRWIKVGKQIEEQEDRQEKTTKDSQTEEIRGDLRLSWTPQIANQADMKAKTNKDRQTDEIRGDLSWTPEGHHRLQIRQT